MEVAFVGAWFIVLGVICIISYSKEPKKDKQKGTLFGLIFFFLIGLSLMVVPIIVSIHKVQEEFYYCTNNNYSYLMDDYGMECEPAINDYGTVNYLKESCIITVYRNGNFDMNERKPFTSSCQESILKKIFNNDGISEMIQGNLLYNAEYMESDSNIFIQYDNYALNILYDEKIQEIFYKYNDSNDHNGSYKELIITHYNNDDPDFDKVLIKLLFDEDISKFELDKEDNNYRYILEG